MLAPAGTPPEVIVRLNTELGRALRAPDLRDRLAQQGADPIVDTPAQFSEHIRREIAKWGAVVRASGAKVD
jgi:tripartite-type tricarboxylate transporter receptor subunit TctC